MNKFNTSFNNILSAKLNGENINHIKTDDGIAIKLAKNFNGYNSLIINTNYGIIFLSKDFKELKKIARLKNYNGTTIKEASKKVNKNFKSIKALIAKLNKNINLIDTRGIQVSSNLIDVRSNKIDMRSNKKYISYIDGKIIESSYSHEDNISNYLSKFKNQIAEDIINRNLDMDNYIYSYASINKINNKLIINEYRNTSFNVIASKLNEVYPSNGITAGLRNVIGTVNASSVTLRTIVEAAIRCQATAVVIAHNHPKGFAIPSEADLAATHEIEKHLKAIGVDLKDHIFVAANDYVSLAQSEML